jgi:hypothetical protein
MAGTPFIGRYRPFSTRPSRRANASAVPTRPEVRRPERSASRGSSKIRSLRRAVAFKAGREYIALLTYDKVRRGRQHSARKQVRGRASDGQDRSERFIGHIAGLRRVKRPALPILGDTQMHDGAGHAEPVEYRGLDRGRSIHAGRVQPEMDLDRALRADRKIVAPRRWHPSELRFNRVCAIGGKVLEREAPRGIRVGRERTPSAVTVTRTPASGVPSQSVTLPNIRDGSAASVARP